MNLRKESLIFRKTTLKKGTFRNFNVTSSSKFSTRKWTKTFESQFLYRQTQNRSFQSISRQKTYGFFDAVTGRFEDPRYPLDLNPWEVKDGQLKYWITDNQGYWAVLTICLSPVLLGLFSIYWYAATDTEVWYA